MWPTWLRNKATEWDRSCLETCACKCCHSEGLLRLHYESFKGSWSVCVEENIGFTAMGVK